MMANTLPLQVNIKVDAGPWKEAWGRAFSFVDYWLDPESDYDMVLAVERAYGVTHE
ncbi:hypothetical protein SEA_VIEENROSE_38 [Streptomyces phage VieEnRose]|nr:hypothetical protein SEA_VIEENROSE_38 [Streptomyces phage VieEnRose]